MRFKNLYLYFLSVGDISFAPSKLTRVATYPTIDTNIGKLTRVATYPTIYTNLGGSRYKDFLKVPARLG